MLTLLNKKKYKHLYFIKFIFIKSAKLQNTKQNITLLSLTESENTLSTH